MTLDFTATNLDALARWLISAEHLLPHYVHVWVYGHYRGCYEKPNRAEAEALLDYKRQSLGHVGCSYELRPCACVPGGCRCGEVQS